MLTSTMRFGTRRASRTRFSVAVQLTSCLSTVGFRSTSCGICRTSRSSGTHSDVGRVIAYDARGSGASDPLPTVDADALLENAAAAFLAVADAAGCRRASILSFHHGTIRSSSPRRILNASGRWCWPICEPRSRNCAASGTWPIFAARAPAKPWYITADRRSDARGRVGTMTVKEVLVSAMNWEGSR